MIIVTARTTQEFFGEPTYLRELTKDLVSAALGFERSDIQVTVEPNTDSVPQAAVTFIIDAVGSHELGNSIEEAFVVALAPGRLTFVVLFTQTSDVIDLDTSAALSAAVGEAKSFANGGMLEANTSNVVAQIENMQGELTEQLIWHHRKFHED